MRGRIERQRGHENVCPDIKDDEVVVMSHVVTDKDLVDMRGDFASLKRRLAGWSQMIENIERASKYIPTSSGRDGDFKGFNPTNKQTVESCMTEALRLATWYKNNPNTDVNIFVVDIQAVLDKSRALQPWDATKAQVSSPKPWEACADTLNFMAEPSIHERLASLKHLGGSYNTGFGSGFYTYSCPVTVYNYTSALNWTPRTLETTVRWNDGDGNLTDALRRIAGSEDQWTISWWDGREGLMFLQANAQDALRLPSSRDKVKLRIYLPYPQS